MVRWHDYIAVDARMDRWTALWKMATRAAHACQIFGCVALSGLDRLSWWADSILLPCRSTCLHPPRFLDLDPPPRPRLIAIIYIQDHQRIKLHWMQWSRKANASTSFPVSNHKSFQIYLNLSNSNQIYSHTKTCTALKTSSIVFFTS